MKFHESPYSTFAGNPINVIDPDGRDTTFADDAARKMFKEALSIVKDNVTKYQDRVDRDKELENKSGFGAWVSRLFRNESSDKANLEDWKKLESDFDRITDPTTPMVSYSTDESKIRNSDHGGEMKPKGDGGVSVVINTGSARLGHAAVIHENRHVNQIFEGTSGYVHNYDLADEIEAYNYQRIFDWKSVDDFIRQSGRLQHGKNWEVIQNFYRPEDAVKYRYVFP